MRETVARLAAATPRFGVVFDIDGVLLLGKKVIPGAQRAIERLKERRVPFAVLTNGGGVLEADKAAQLSALLGTNIAPEQCLLSHSPLRDGAVERALTSCLNDGATATATAAPQRPCRPTVLALGSLRYLEVAQDVLSKHVALVTVPDVVHAFPNIYPFTPAVPTEEAVIPSHRRGDPRGPFHAAVVFHDPVDWAPELQVLTDCLQLERGVGQLGVEHARGCPAAVPPERRVKFFHTQNDFVFQGTYPNPRFAQGSFVECAKHLFRRLVGQDLAVTGVYGKPEAAAYAVAARSLEAQVQLLPPGKGGGSSGGVLERFYMVGDNPRSDIAGVCRLQEEGEPWTSYLVRTGVFQSAADNDATHPASHVVADVEQAVSHILRREINLI